MYHHDDQQHLQQDLDGIYMIIGIVNKIDVYFLIYIGLSLS